MTIDTGYGSGTGPAPERRSAADRCGAHAIVIGAGVGGLATCAALADHFDRVTVIERDVLPFGAMLRPGTPQASQLHGLLTGGVVALGALFPGFGEQLAVAGMRPSNLMRDVRYELPGFDPFPRRDLGLRWHPVTRPLLDAELRRRIRQLPNVTVLQQCRALAITPNADGSAGGVRYEMHGATETLPADLIVDASGRGTLTEQFLWTTGHSQVETTTIGIDVSYATTSFAVPPGRRDWNAILTMPDPSAPDSRASYLFQVEADRWMVLIGERHAEKPVADEADFMARLGSLRTRSIYDAVKDARRLDPIHRFAFPESAWRHYDRLAGFPRGLLPLGDAFCRFNPIYGQGMTVAAQEACVLKGVLRDLARGSDPLAGLSSAYFAGATPFIGTAWQMSAVPDFACPQTRGERPADLDESLRFMAGLQRLAARDADVHRLVMQVHMLVKTGAALQDPDLVQRVRAEMAEA